MLGRRDAKRYGSLLDFTPTHSLLRAESEAQQGQHKVNAWLIRQVAPEQTGNERILVQMRKAQDDRSAILADKTSSARGQNQNALRLERLDSNLANMEAQWRANVSKARGAIQTADQALGTWDKYYSQIAAIYARARAIAGRQDVSAVAAEIPTMKFIPLVEVEGFDDDQLPKAAGGRR
jgi:multidrug efflux pump subunit AcrA (membrane-fusion protein)